MIPILVISFLVAANAFFVAAEYAVVGVSRVRAQRLVSERRLGARLVLSLVGEPRRLDRAITACQIAISATSIVLGAYAQIVLAPAVSPWLARLGWSPGAAATMAVVLILLAVTGLQLVLGEQVPKSIAVRYPPRWALLTAHPLAASMVILAPGAAISRTSSPS